MHLFQTTNYIEKWNILQTNIDDFLEQFPGFRASMSSKNSPTMSTVVHPLLSQFSAFCIAARCQDMFLGGVFLVQQEINRTMSMQEQSTKSIQIFPILT